MDRREALAGIQSFVVALHTAGVFGKPKETRDWMRNHTQELNRWFGYEGLVSMPSVSSLIDFDYHPNGKLIILNYSHLAHNTLHLHHGGWTLPIMQCRGLVLDFAGHIRSIAFEKFWGQNDGTDTVLPEGPLEITVKEDGHMIAIFEYDGAFIATTRGYFSSRTSVLAQAWIDAHAAKHSWAETNALLGHTVCAEFIHPQTRVVVNYGGLTAMRIIASFGHDTLSDALHDELVTLGQVLNLPVVELVTESVETIVARLQTAAYGNREGYVVRSTTTGERVKLKYASYIGFMRTGKLSPRYIVTQLKAGKLPGIMEHLPSDAHQHTCAVVGELYATATGHQTQQDAWRALYELRPDGGDSWKDTCRDFVKFGFAHLPEKPAPQTKKKKEKN